jgi:hypothetical protein
MGTMNALKVGAFLLLPLITTGCVAALKGRPDLPIRLSESSARSPYAKEIKRLLVNADAYEKKYVSSYSAGSDAPELKLYRNEYAYTMLAIYELTYQHYAKSLQIEARGGAFALSTAKTSLGVADLIVSSVSTKNIITAISGSLDNFKSNYNVDLIVNSSIQSILNNMLAEQTVIRKNMIDKLKDDNVADYPLSAVQLDLVSIGSVTTMEKALSTSTAKSEENLSKAQRDTASEEENSDSGNGDNG